MIRLGARFWAWVPAGLLGVMLVGLGSLATIAADDPGFALERDYYQKAVAFDRELAQRAENARLEWKFDVSAGALGADGTATMRIEIAGPAGPLSGARVQVEALRNAAAFRVLEAFLPESGPGQYESELRFDHGGLWEVRVAAEQGNSRATHVARIQLAEPL